MPNPTNHQELLELEYGLLTEERSAELQAAIASDPAVRLQHEQARRDARQFKAAARLPVAPIKLILPASEPARSVPAPGRSAWLPIAVAAGVAIAVFFGGRTWLDHQSSGIHGQALAARLIVPPAQDFSGPTTVAVATTDVHGKAVAADLDWSVVQPDGSELHRQQTKSTGSAVLAIPSSITLVKGSTLQVAARSAGNLANVETKLVSAAPRRKAEIQLDRSLYRPGETVRFRSVVQSPSGTPVAQAIPFVFEVRSAVGELLPQSVRSGATQQAVAAGEFAIPASLSAGVYLVVAKAPDGAFPTAKMPFIVDSPSSKQQTNDTFVDLYAEHGFLEPNVPGRVYCHARQANGRPAKLTFDLVDAKGSTIVKDIATDTQGVGAFTIKAEANFDWQFVAKAPGSTKIVTLSMPRVAEHPSRLSVESTLVDAGTALALRLASVSSENAYWVAGFQNNALVAQQIVTGASESISLKLPAEVTGPVKLVAFEVSGKPNPIGQRWVHVRPAKQVGLQLTSTLFPRDDKSVTVTISSRDANNLPLGNTILGVNVGRPTLKLGADLSPSMSVGLHSLTEQERGFWTAYLASLDQNGNELETESNKATDTLAHLAPRVTHNLQQVQNSVAASQDLLRTSVLWLAGGLACLSGLGLVGSVFSRRHTSRPNLTPWLAPTFAAGFAGMLATLPVFQPSQQPPALLLATSTLTPEAPVDAKVTPPSLAEKVAISAREQRLLALQAGQAFPGPNVDPSRKPGASDFANNAPASQNKPVVAAHARPGSALPAKSNGFQFDAFTLAPEDEPSETLYWNPKATTDAQGNFTFVIGRNQLKDGAQITVAAQHPTGQRGALTAQLSETK